jgi:excisionase family DNA binding protein
LQAPQDAAPGERVTFTVEEVAKRLGISRNFAYDCVNRGEIPAVRIGRRLLVPKVALEKMLGGLIASQSRGECA